MKKILLMILAAAMIFGCAACKNDDSDTPSDVTDTSQSGNTSAVTPTPVCNTHSPDEATPTPEVTPTADSKPAYDWEEDWNMDIGWVNDDGGELYCDGSNTFTRVTTKKTYDITTVKSITVDFMYYEMVNTGIPDGNFAIGFLNPSEEFYLFSINTYNNAARIHDFLNMDSATLLSEKSVDDYGGDDTWHKLKVTVSSDEIRMYLDDTLIGSENKGGYDKVINGSSIFLQSYNSYITFRNIVIE